MTLDCISRATSSDPATQHHLTPMRSRTARLEQALRSGTLPGRVDAASLAGMGAGKTYYVYLTSSGPRGVLYVGMTSDLPRRVHEHHDRLLAGFTQRFWVDRLVYWEAHTEARVAANRERALKRWRRAWKIELVEQSNPTWRDLHGELLQAHGFEV